VLTAEGVFAERHPAQHPGPSHFPGFPSLVPPLVVENITLLLRNDCVASMCNAFMFCNVLYSTTFLSVSGSTRSDEGDYLATSSIRALVVDDFEPFRRLLCSTLHNKLELQTVVEASDGAEAIELAKILQPDLILLDIGLPKVDGIEAAKRIRALVPQSKILFVSLESSIEVVQAALSAGASGYVVKMDVGSELPTAVNAVLRGEKFVGSRFAGHGFTLASDAQLAGSDLGEKVVGLPQRQT
jgi:DNA-binding NarL/FixJ family response regulator